MMRTPASMGIHTPKRKLEGPPSPAGASGDADLWVIARRALEAGQRVIGIVPAAPARSRLQVAWALAEALATLTPGSIAIIDADGSDIRGATRDVAQPLVLARWLAPRIALLGPERAPRVGEAAATVRRLVQYARERAGASVVDLSGLERHGEIAGALGACDGVVIVAEAGRTKEREVRAAAKLVGEPLLLGVLLTA